MPRCGHAERGLRCGKTGKPITQGAPSSDTETGADMSDVDQTAGFVVGTEHEQARERRRSGGRVGSDNFSVQDQLFPPSGLGDGREQLRERCGDLVAVAAVEIDAPTLGPANGSHAVLFHLDRPLTASLGGVRRFASINLGTDTNVSVTRENTDLSVLTARVTDRGVQQR